MSRIGCLCAWAQMAREVKVCCGTHLLVKCRQLLEGMYRWCLFCPQSGFRCKERNERRSLSADLVSGNPVSGNPENGNLVSLGNCLAVTEMSFSPALSQTVLNIGSHHHQHQKKMGQLGPNACQHSNPLRFPSRSWIGYSLSRNKVTACWIGHSLSRDTVTASWIGHSLSRDPVTASWIGWRGSDRGSLPARSLPTCPLGIRGQGVSSRSADSPRSWSELPCRWWVRGRGQWRLRMTLGEGSSPQAPLPASLLFPGSATPRCFLPALPLAGLQIETCPFRNPSAITAATKTT